MLFSRDGRSIRFAEEEVSVVGRTAQGVKGMGLRGKDEVVGMILVRRDAAVLTVSEDGMGKRTPVSEFPLQQRGGLGTLAVPSGAKISPIVCALEVLDTDELVIVTASGKVTRASAGAVPVQGRRTQGRRLAQVAKGDHVVEVTRGGGEGGTPARDPIGGVQAELQFDYD
jgi:DNA gyrase subunit A